jgi:hypothetical protein
VKLPKLATILISIAWKKECTNWNLSTRKKRAGESGLGRRAGSDPGHLTKSPSPANSVRWRLIALMVLRSSPSWLSSN